jgi:hypothetical protein
MGGQAAWSQAGTATNAYPVRFNLDKEIYYYFQYKSIFGKLNMGRMVKTIAQKFGQNTMSIDSGNASPVWEKPIVDGDECRLTLREENKGLATYGEADVAAGDFATYMHSVIRVNAVHSPAYPIPGIVSAERIKEMIRDLVGIEKENIGVWGGKEQDLDGFRSLFCGASRGLLISTNGGLGITLYGGSAGAQRSCYNVTTGATTGSLVTPSATLATHEGNVENALTAINSDDESYGFSWAKHRGNLYLLDYLNIPSATVGKTEYRSIALCDPRLVDRLVRDSSLQTAMQHAYARGKDNPALYNMNAFVLDDILYLPCKQMEYFRPTPNAGTSDVTYGCGTTSDPRSSSFSNTSNICAIAYMGQGALLRGKKSEVWWTEETGRHGVGAEYAVHYWDGWLRHEWFSKDDRTQMKNDRSLMAFYYDPGVGSSFATT